VATANLQLTGEREGVILTYIDATQGWLATSGINEGTDALGPVPYSVDFLVIAGGGGGGGGAVQEVQVVVVQVVIEIHIIRTSVVVEVRNRLITV
jgi:hypothetical protein